MIRGYFHRDSLILGGLLLPNPRLFSPSKNYESIMKRFLFFLLLLAPSTPFSPNAAVSSQPRTKDWRRGSTLEETMSIDELLDDVCTKRLVEEHQSRARKLSFPLHSPSVASSYKCKIQTRNLELTSCLSPPLSPGRLPKILPPSLPPVHSPSSRIVEAMGWHGPPEDLEVLHHSDSLQRRSVPQSPLPLRHK